MSQNISQLSLLTLTEGKTCKQCGEWKPLVKFLKGGYVGGRSPRCRNCTDPPERQRERDRARYRTPQRYQAVRMRVKRWVERHPDQTRQYRSAYYQKHKRKLDQDNEAYRANNPHIMQAVRSRRRARLYSATGIFTGEHWQVICERYGSICLRCKRSDRPLTIDHVVPLSKNGFHCACNVQPLCHSCNTQKHARVADYRPFRVQFGCPHEAVEMAE